MIAIPRSRDPEREVLNGQNGLLANRTEISEEADQAWNAMSEWGRRDGHDKRAERYRLRARQVRAIAAEVKKPETRKLLEQMVVEWEHMAAGLQMGSKGDGRGADGTDQKPARSQAQES